jgi:catechol 2,3-dioxygenase-like lactoylglutathione lyase family enzyme
MSTQTGQEHATHKPGVETVDMKLEVVPIPVSDVDRAKRFYEGLGWRLDADFSGENNFRGIQITPPGSPCSIHFGRGVTAATPGSVQNLYLVVSDMEAARAELISHGADVSQAFHLSGFGGSPVPGPDPKGGSYTTLATFKDPDGNGWLLQEIKTRFPGRGFSSSDVGSLTELLRETEKRHSEYEPTAPEHHWSEWYAAYVVARERGKTSDEAAKAAKVHIEGPGDRAQA